MAVAAGVMDRVIVARGVVNAVEVGEKVTSVSVGAGKVGDKVAGKR